MGEDHWTMIVLLVAAALMAFWVCFDVGKDGIKPTRHYWWTP